MPVKNPIALIHGAIRSKQIPKEDTLVNMHAKGARTTTNDRKINHLAEILDVRKHITNLFLLIVTFGIFVMFEVVLHDPSIGRKDVSPGYTIYANHCVVVVRREFKCFNFSKDKSFGQKNENDHMHGQIIFTIQNSTRAYELGNSFPEEDLKAEKEVETSATIKKSGGLAYEIGKTFPGEDLKTDKEGETSAAIKKSGNLAYELGKTFPDEDLKTEKEGEILTAIKKFGSLTYEPGKFFPEKYMKTEKEDETSSAIKK